MNTLEQTTQLAIELIKQQQATDYEFSVGKSSGVSTSVRLSEVETLKYHLDASFDVSVYIGKSKGQATSVDLSKKSLKNAIESACLIAKYTQEDPFSGLAPSELFISGCSRAICSHSMAISILFLASRFHG